MEIKDKILNITTKVNPSNISYDYTFQNKILKSLSRKEFSVLYVNDVNDPYGESKICINNIYDEYQIENVEYGSMYAPRFPYDRGYNLVGYFEDENTRIFLTTCSDSAYNRVITVYNKTTMGSKYYAYYIGQDELDLDAIMYLQYVNNTIYIIPGDVSYGMFYATLSESQTIFLNNGTFKAYNVTLSRIVTGAITGRTIPGGILYNNYIYILPDSASFTPFKIKCADKTTSQITFDTSLANKKITYISQIGENNDFGYKGQMCFLNIDGDLYTVDMEDLTVSVISTTYHNYDYIPSNDGIFITNQQEMHFLKYSQMEIFSYMVDKSAYIPVSNIKYYTMAICEKSSGTPIITQYLMGYNVNSTYMTKPYSTTNCALYQIRCFDTSNALIKTVLQYATSAATIKAITPPIIDGYELNTNIIATLPTLSTAPTLSADSFTIGIKTIDYIYKKTVTQVTFTVKSVTSIGEELSSYNVVYNIGETYDIQPDEIPGYELASSENNTGTVSEESLINIIFTYGSLDILPTESVTGAFVNIRCIDNAGNVLLNKYDTSYKGETVATVAPTIPGYINIYSPPDPVICTTDVNTIIYLYRPALPTTKIAYRCNGVTIFEEIVLNPLGTITLTPPSYLSVTSTTFNTKQAYFTVQCTITSPITVLQIVNDIGFEVHSILIEEKITSLDRQLLFPNGLPNNTKHITYNNFDLYKIIFVIDKVDAYVYHMVDDTVIELEESSPSINSTLSITPMDPNMYTMLSPNSTRYTIFYYDKYIFVKYTDRLYKTVFKTINLLNNAILKTDTFSKLYNVSFDYNYSDVTNYLTVASTAAKTGTYQNCDKEYYFYVIPTSFKPTCSLTVNNNKIVITNNSPVKYGYAKLYTVVGMNKTNIYRSKRIFYVYSKTDGVDIDIISALGESEYNLIPYDKFVLADIPDNSIVIDGHYANKKKYLNLPTNSRILYMPLNVVYTSITTTLSDLIYCSYNYTDGNIRTSKINITPTVTNKKYSKRDGVTSVYVNTTHNIVQNKVYNVSMVFPQYNITIDSTVNYTINTVGTFKKSFYVINDDFNTEPTSHSSSGTNVIKFKKQRNSIVIDEMLHYYMVDEFGNITNTAHENIYIEIGNNTVPNTLFEEKHIYTISKLNHRFRGIKESAKFYNFYKQYWNNLEYLEAKINEISNGINIASSDKLNSIRYEGISIYDSNSYKTLNLQTYAYLEQFTHEQLSEE